MRDEKQRAWRRRQCTKLLRDERQREGIGGG
jgi:hypothetical protein